MKLLKKTFIYQQWIKDVNINIIDSTINHLINGQPSIIIVYMYIHVHDYMYMYCIIGKHEYLRNADIYHPTWIFWFIVWIPYMYM